MTKLRKVTTYLRIALRNIVITATLHYVTLSFFGVYRICHVSGTFEGDFILTVRQIFLLSHRQYYF